jgi:hypothetical protein
LIFIQRPDTYLSYFGYKQYGSWSTYMQSTTQLLCTFTAAEHLEKTVLEIRDTYHIAFDAIYVLENVNSPASLCCTYNVFKEAPVKGETPPMTISLHRKKLTNTLYTINALNVLVAELNEGVVDTKFQVPWEEFQNTILVIANGQLKRINTKLQKIVKISTL